MVRSKIVTKQGEETAVDYRMLRKPGGHWRAYDVKVEGVSLVANYRAQFNHWGRRFGFYKSANNLTLSSRDPTSKQPELNALRVRRLVDLGVG